MVGGLLVPFMKRHIFQRILLYCVGLGVGTLASAGCLVLLPEVKHISHVVTKPV